MKELSWRTKNGVNKTPNKPRRFHHNLCPTEARGPVNQGSVRMNPSPSPEKLKMVKVNTNQNNKNPNDENEQKKVNCECLRLISSLASTYSSCA